MSEPKRIQLSRRAGWRLPGGAVKVDRTTKWGNPFALGEPVSRGSDLWPYLVRTVPGVADQPGLLGKLNSVTLHQAEYAVEAFAWWFIEQPALMITVAAEIGGHDLACWCKLPRAGEPDICHAAFLLEMANETEWAEA